MAALWKWMNIQGSNGKCGNSPGTLVCVQWNRLRLLCSSWRRKCLYNKAPVWDSSVSSLRIMRTELSIRGLFRSPYRSSPSFTVSSLFVSSHRWGRIGMMEGGMRTPQRVNPAVFGSDPPFLPEPCHIHQNLVPERNNIVFLPEEHWWPPGRSDGGSFLKEPSTSLNFLLLRGGSRGLEGLGWQERRICWMNSQSDSKQGCPCRNGPCRCWTGEEV